jgi:hypothetical protein
LDTQLFVIGDSHANFWNGSGNWQGEDSIPGVRTHPVPAALAYNLVEEVSTTDSRRTVLEALFGVVEKGFHGWVMLGFGSVDCQLFVWQHAPTLGFEESVRRVVKRYAAFLRELRLVHEKIAVWGPFAAHESAETDTAVGTQIERNLALLLFTGMLKRELASSRIPVLSMLEEMIDAEGRTRRELYQPDLTHFTQALMPRALSLVNSALGTSLDPGQRALSICEQRITAFERVEILERFDQSWLSFLLPEGAQLLTHIALWQSVFAVVRTISIATSVDGKTYDFFDVTVCTEGAAARDQEYIPINRHARHILIRGHRAALAHSDVACYIQASRLSTISHYHRGSLLAMRDALLGPYSSVMPSVKEEVPAVSFSAPPGMRVPFSAPP